MRKLCNHPVLFAKDKISSRQNFQSIISQWENVADIENSGKFTALR